MNFKTFKKGIVLGVAILAICALSVPAALAKNDKPKKAQKGNTRSKEGRSGPRPTTGRPEPADGGAQRRPLINGAPHYFSHPNYANSPLPTIEGSLIYVRKPAAGPRIRLGFPCRRGRVGTGLRGAADLRCRTGS